MRVLHSRMKNRESGVRIASRCRIPLLSMPLLSLPPQRCKSPKLFPPRLSQVLHPGQTNLGGNVTEICCAASTHGTTRFRHQPHSLVRVWGELDERERGEANEDTFLALPQNSVIQTLYKSLNKIVHGGQCPRRKEEFVMMPRNGDLTSL